MYKLIMLMLFAIPLQAQEYDPQVKTCMYIGGIAREAQNIRQVEKHSLDQFVATVNKMYKSGNGLNQLILIATHVYNHVGSNVNLTTVFNTYFDQCMIRSPTSEGVSI